MIEPRFDALLGMPVILRRTMVSASFYSVWILRGQPTAGWPLPEEPTHQCKTPINERRSKSETCRQRENKQ